MEGKPTYKARRRCRFCGRPLPPVKRSGSGGRNRRYCNNRCKQAAYRRRKAENGGELELA